MRNKALNLLFFSLILISFAAQAGTLDKFKKKNPFYVLTVKNSKLDEEHVAEVVSGLPEGMTHLEVVFENGFYTREGMAVLFVRLEGLEGLTHVRVRIPQGVTNPGYGMYGDGFEAMVRSMLSAHHLESLEIVFPFGGRQYAMAVQQGELRNFFRALVTIYDSRTSPEVFNFLVEVPAGGSWVRGRTWGRDGRMRFVETEPAHTQTFALAETMPSYMAEAERWRQARERARPAPPEVAESRNETDVGAATTGVEVEVVDEGEGAPLLGANATGLRRRPAASRRTSLMVGSGCL